MVLPRLCIVLYWYLRLPVVVVVVAFMIVFTLACWFLSCFVVSCRGTDRPSFTLPTDKSREKKVLIAQQLGPKWDDGEVARACRLTKKTSQYPPPPCLFSLSLYCLVLFLVFVFFSLCALSCDVLSRLVSSCL